MGIPDTVPPAAALERWVDSLTHPSSEVARRSVLALRAGCPDATRFVDTVLTPCQHEVGRRWMRGTITATMEHRVTALFERIVLESLPPVTARGGPATRAVVAVEGEQHTLAPLLLVWLAAEAGGRVDHLGAGVPAADLDAHLAQRPYSVVAVSCTTTSRLVGALHTIDVLREHGCVVVAGGAGFGAGGQYGVLLGADAAATSLADGVRLLSTTDAHARRSPLDPGRVAEATLVDHQAGAIASDVLGRLADDADLLLGPAGFLDLIATSVRVTAAALLLDRPEIVTGHNAWLHELLMRRRGAGWAAGPAMRHVVDAVAQRAPAAHGLRAAVED
jgi:methanogenic corrinoid protein MtbC1